MRKVCILRKIIVLCLLCLAGSLPLKAQYSDLATHEILLDSLFKHLRVADNDARRIRLNDSVQLILQTMLDAPDAFSYPFERLDYLGKVYSEDRRLRFYTWCFATDSALTFHCIIQRATGTWQQWYTEHPYVPDTARLLRDSEWYGALYYRAIPMRYNKGKTVYVLLGWGRASMDSVTQYKVIDVLHEDDNGEMVLGLPVFDNGDKYFQHRCVFEYDAQSAFSVEYDGRKRIYADHLSPGRIDAEGRILSYGADMSVDVYQHRGRRWILRQDVKAKGQKNKPQSKL